MEPTLSTAAMLETAVFLLESILSSLLFICGVTVGTAVLAYVLDFLYDLEII